MTGPDHDEVLGDSEARENIAAGGDRRAVVVAGAGSGKTTALVARVVRLLASGTDPGRIAVITFTEKAARELIHRLRAEGIDGIDRAYVGTIHGFCRQILSRYPIEAGVPPVFSVVDEITSASTAAERNTAAVNALFDRVDGEPELEEALVVFAERSKLGALPEVAGLIDSQWDRFGSADLAAPEGSAVRRKIDRAVEPIRQYVRLAEVGEVPESLAAKLAGPVVGWLDYVARATIRELAMGSQNIESTGTSGGASWKHARDEIKAAALLVQAIAADTLVRRVLAGLAPAVLEAAESRLAAGELNFEDLLVLTRRLLREEPVVRAELRSELTHVFVDEFQDTDPVQFEIIRLLCDRREGETEGPVLFAVGDPKQAIYSFRNADVALFNALVAEAESVGSRHELTTNFRTRPRVATWINETMRARFDEAGSEVQANYEDLVAARDDVSDDPGPAVVVLGLDANGDLVAVETAAKATAHEVADLVALVSESVGTWVVGDRSGRRPIRTARYGDIAVLMRSRTGLAVLEQGLRAANIPYRIEGGTLVYESREVYEILRVLRAIADPASDAAVVAALRTSIFAVSDIDLFEYRHGPGRARSWHLPAVDESFDRVEDPRPGPARVRQAMRVLRGWADEAYHRSPATLIAEIYDDRLGAAVAAFEGPVVEAELRRRVRFVIDEARAWSDATSGTLAEYLAWVATRVEGVERAEIATDEGEDSVRIMTVHAAKGLQFPIVAVVGLGRKPPTESGVFARWADGRPELNIVKDLSTLGARSDESKLLAVAEEARLLYVAMTRAEDHLIVSMWCGAKSWDTPAQRLAPCLFAPLDHRREPAEVGVDDGTAAELSDVVGASRGLELPQLLRPMMGERSIWTPSGLSRRRDPSPRADAAPIDHEAERDIDDNERAVVVAAIATVGPGERDPGKDKDPPTGLDLQRSRGRYGTEVGIAVHEVMQFIDLRDPELGLAELVATSCAAADVAPEHHATVFAHVRELVGSAVFQELRHSPEVHREVYVGTTSELDGDPITLWGYVDAIYRAPDGRLVVVDYKTDSTGADLGELAVRYQAQMDAYRVAVERVTGESGVRTVLAITQRGITSDDEHRWRNTGGVV